MELELDDRRNGKPGELPGQPALVTSRPHAMPLKPPACEAAAGEDAPSRMRPEGEHRDGRAGMPASRVAISHETATTATGGTSTLNDIHDIDALAVAVPYCVPVPTDRADVTRSPRHAISSPSVHSFPASGASPAAFTRSGIAWLARLRWPSMSRTGASCRTTLSFRVIAIRLPDPIPEDVDTVAASLAEMIVTAANGVRWRRLPGSASSAEEFLAVLAGLGGDRIAREWSLWREGEPRREDDRRHEVLFQWEHAGPPPGPYLTAEELEARFEARWAETQRQREARAAEYDHDRDGPLEAAERAGRCRVQRGTSTNVGL